MISCLLFLFSAHSSSLLCTVIVYRAALRVRCLPKMETYSTILNQLNSRKSPSYKRCMTMKKSVLTLLNYLHACFGNECGDVRFMYSN